MEMRKMMQKRAKPSEEIDYFFTKAKNTHEENGSVYITLFARLTRETTKTIGTDTYQKIESVWVGIDEVRAAQATEKIRVLPEKIQKFRVSKAVFENMMELSATCPDELYYITPLHENQKRKHSRG